MVSSRETSFDAADEGGVLRGTILRPEGEGPLPAALLLVGSGPLDRDSNMKRQKLNLTAELAVALADVGVVSLRFDKRGAGDSDGDFHATGFIDNINDAERALAHLRSQSDVDPGRVVVIGHSAGALIAAELARRSSVSAPLAGVALLAGAARNGREVLVWQAHAVADSLPVPVRLLLRLFRTDLVKMQTKRLPKLESSTGDTMRVQGVKINARWFREFMAFDPAASLEGLETPVLALTGQADVQVPAEDVAVMGSLVAGPFRGEVLADLSHLFRPDPDRKGVRGYKASLAQPLDPDFVRQLTDWVSATLAPLST